MTTGIWLKQATKELERSGIGTARLDSLVLLEDVSGRDRAWLLAHPEHELSSDQLVVLTKLLNLRVEHQPLAYVRGKTEFYGRTFVITPAVLEPRPESETMIDLLKQLSDLPAEPRIADVGAGSGALGITAKLEMPNAHVELLEIDPKALQVAKTNVDKLSTAMQAVQSDLLSGSDQLYDVLLCNLPYVPDGHQINQAARQEPSIAIFGGPDGLDLYRRLFGQAKKILKQPLYILSESLPPQHEALHRIATQNGYELVRASDFIQVFKIATLKS